MVGGHMLGHYIDAAQGGRQTGNKGSERLQPSSRSPDPHHNRPWALFFSGT